MKSRIVVIDDEPQIRKMLRIALNSEGYEVIEAGSAGSALTAVARQQPDLIILDLGLPDRDGYYLLREVREWSQVPVIVLSVRDSEKEKVSALDNGAQDYVTKPFSVEELLARIRATLRDRTAPLQSSVLNDGQLTIDLAKRLIVIDGESVELTKREYAVLSRLALSPNCVVTQSHLLDEIWGPGHRGDTHYLRIVVSHLRQKLQDDATEPRYIRTEPGVGYRLVFQDQS